jgi:hypothetical protein
VILPEEYWHHEAKTGAVNPKAELGRVNDREELKGKLVRILA